MLPAPSPWEPLVDVCPVVTTLACCFPPFGCVCFFAVMASLALSGAHGVTVRVSGGGPGWGWGSRRSALLIKTNPQLARRVGSRARSFLPLAPQCPQLARIASQKIIGGNLVNSINTGWQVGRGLIEASRKDRCYWPDVRRGPDGSSMNRHGRSVRSKSSKSTLQDAPRRTQPAARARRKKENNSPHNPTREASAAMLPFTLVTVCSVMPASSLGRQNRYHTTMHSVEMV